MRDKQLKKRSTEYFDKVAKDREIIPEPELCYPYVLELLEGFGQAELLDVGCGTGKMIQSILEKYPDKFHLHGVDLSQNSLKLAEENSRGRAVLLVGDSESLPYPEGQMDIVLCMHSFHHYPHPEKALSEIRRVLKKNGHLIFVENEYSWYRRNRLNLSFVIRRHPTGDVRMYSRKQLVKKLERSGFRVEDAKHIADHSQLLFCVK